MKILKVEEFEFCQYFENEVKGQSKGKEEPENNQEQSPTEKVDREPEAGKQEPGETMEPDPIPVNVPSPPMPDAMVAALLQEAEQQSTGLMTKAALDASEIVNLAKERASSIEEEARTRGYDQGYDEGKQAALDRVEQEQRALLQEKYEGLMEAAYQAAVDLELQKEASMKQHLKDLANLALTVAEKVINISLQSSGEVIERMILSTMETSNSYQWAKIRISAQDEQLMKESGVDLASAMKHVADRVKIVVIEDAPLGTCYVEFPDQIIDAGVETQLTNIREVVSELQF